MATIEFGQDRSTVRASTSDRSTVPGGTVAGHSVSEGDFDVIGFHEFTPTAEEIIAARHFVRQTLEASTAVPQSVVDGAELAVDEFAVNAVRHAGTFFSVSVAVMPGAVKVAVRDDSDVFPHFREHALLSMAGRGLTIVASTVEQWGATSLGHGKEVWAVLR